jgi:hypothetical protein
MDAIPFTQFMMPSGRRVPVSIVRPAAVLEQAAALIAQGCRFEIEMLRTGEISMEIVRGESKVLAGEIVHNGLPVPIAVDKMIQDATSYFAKLKRTKERLNGAANS